MAKMKQWLSNMMYTHIAMKYEKVTLVLTLVMLNLFQET